MKILQTVRDDHTYVFKYGDRPKDRQLLFQSVGKLSSSREVNFTWGEVAKICWQAVKPRDKQR